jgi:NADPH2:quinone reductase
MRFYFNGKTILIWRYIAFVSGSLQNSSKEDEMEMRFVDMDGFGSAEVLKFNTRPVPTPKADEVLIKVKAFGINRPDIAQRSGSYPPPKDASPHLGLEVSGIIESVGLSSRRKVGDEVCALTAGGGYAEYCLAHSDLCLPLPKNVSLIHAAGIPETFFTSWSNVFNRGKLQSGETFLVHGGTSGIGVTSIQLAKAFGATVVCTAGSEEKVQAARRLGADVAINYKTHDFSKEVKDVHLILDMIGGDYFEKNIECLALEGRLVQIATLQGPKVNFDLRKMMSKRLTLSGSTLRPQTIEQKSLIANQLLKHVWPLFESGQIKVIVDQVFDFEDIQEAHKRMESSQHIGKIIVAL